MAGEAKGGCVVRYPTFGGDGEVPFLKLCGLGRWERGKRALMIILLGRTWGYRMGTTWKPFVLSVSFHPHCKTYRVAGEARGIHMAVGEKWEE
jgi:hypothetical protein